MYVIIWYHLSPNGRLVKCANLAYAILDDFVFVDPIGALALKSYRTVLSGGRLTAFTLGAEHGFATCGHIEKCCGATPAITVRVLYRLFGHTPIDGVFLHLA